jgi:hypothetical protein
VMVVEPTEGRNDEQKTIVRAHAVAPKACWFTTERHSGTGQTAGLLDVVQVYAESQGAVCSSGTLGLQGHALGDTDLA